MSSRERQIIGILADDRKETGRDSVIINSYSAIQYFVRSIMSNAGANDIYTGYVSSFTEDFDYTDDEYLPDYEREKNFREYIDNKLFVYSYKNSDSQYEKMAKVSVVSKPIGYKETDVYNAVPVFASKNDEIIKEWENYKRWNLYREYTSLDEFYETIKEQRSVGSLYCYDAEKGTPSFVVWKDGAGRLYAIGKVLGYSYNSLGGLMLDSNKLYKIDISDYIKFIVYDMDVNPTVIFIPESIYKEIEDRIIKEEVSRKKQEKIEEKTEDIFIDTFDQVLENNDNKITGIKELVKPSNEELEEIDTKEKTDELLIKLMDYHSQKRYLYYDIKDLINVHTAIKSSDLVILSGLSGTGKSALVEVYARALGINNDNNDRLLFIPVRPSWNDDADLLGYVDLVHNVYRPSDTGFVDFLVNAQKEKNKGNMYIVCFDEMNLARVEHYFSQFLSILERPSNKRELQLYDNQYKGRLYNSKDYPSSITIGDNIRFIGTVNIDESTYHFSDKVLDRANVIELDVLDYSKEWKNKQYASLTSTTWSRDDYDRIIKKNPDVRMDEIQSLLWDIHKLLQSASSKYGVGPRIVKSIKTYLHNLPENTIGDFDIKMGLDYQIKQRVLTKVRGPEIQIGSLLKEDNENNFIALFDKYSELSEFKKCRAIIKQKQKELETYGYCI